MHPNLVCRLVSNALSPQAASTHWELYLYHGNAANIQGTCLPLMKYVHLSHVTKAAAHIKTKGKISNDTT